LFFCLSAISDELVSQTVNTKLPLISNIGIWSELNVLPIEKGGKERSYCFLATLIKLFNSLTYPFTNSPTSPYLCRLYKIEVGV
jgi:hypothetical protein